MSAGLQAIRGVLLDSFGTLLELQAPVDQLCAQLDGRFGVQVSAEQARVALSAEITYYRDHMASARDAESLAALRLRCAEVLRDALPAQPGLCSAEPERLAEVLMGSLRFRVYPEVPETLALLRAAGLRLVVVSNWDVSLAEVLARCGLAAMLDGVVSSAVVGAAKPDPRPFAIGLQLAGVAAAQAVHVGDIAAEDVAGALAAGVRPVLLRRDGETLVARDEETLAARGGEVPAAVTVISSLSELPALLGI
ncbi:MAG: HAD family hydrolase [Solirubrobacteraceae bacterium]